MSTQMTKMLQRMERAGFTQHQRSLSVFASFGDHLKRGKFAGSAHNVFGYGDTPESAIAAAVDNAISLQQRSR